MLYFAYLGFDFCKMNDVLDFYVIEFATFNECCDEFLHSGVTPLDSTDPAVMTLVRLVSNTWVIN